MDKPEEEQQLTQQHSRYCDLCLSQWLLRRQY